MNYRIASMLASESATVPATKTIDIDLNKPISRITIQMKGTNSTSVPTAHPAKMLTKIELVDGSNVLYSLNGLQAQAINFYESGKLPLGLISYAADVQCAAVAEINFGRYLWDEQLAFDPAKFSNPQLRISHNLALGGSLPDAATLNVFAHAFDDKVPVPVGFLMSKEQFAYTLVASAKESIDLATDLPYRFLFVKSLTAGKQPWEQYNQIKLTENNDSRVVINDEKTSDLIKLLQDYPRFKEYIQAYGLGAACSMYCASTYEVAVSALGVDSADAALFSTQPYGGVIVATGTAAKLSQWQVSGFMPHGVLAIPFGKRDIMEDWYDVTKVGSLKLILTAGSGASGTCQIMSQQLRKY